MASSAHHRQRNQARHGGIWRRFMGGMAKMAAWPSTRGMAAKAAAGEKSGNNREKRRNHGSIKMAASRHKHGSGKMSHRHISNISIQRRGKQSGVIVTCSASASKRRRTIMAYGGGMPNHRKHRRMAQSAENNVVTYGVAAIMASNRHQQHR